MFMISHSKIWIIMMFIFITVACTWGCSKRPIIIPATVQLQNNCTVIGSYARRLLYNANNRCTITWVTSAGTPPLTWYDHTTLTIFWAVTCWTCKSLLNHTKSLLSWDCQVIRQKHSCDVGIPLTIVVCSHNTNKVMVEQCHIPQHLMSTTCYYYWNHFYWDEFKK